MLEEIKEVFATIAFVVILCLAGLASVVAYRLAF